MEIQKLYQLFTQSKGVCTDTRQISEGVIFFALKGTSFNGNTFALQALKNGALAAVIDEEPAEKDDKLILVDDVLKTLQQLANYHRRQFNIPFIGITGSNGKTTSKELIAAVLSKKYKTYATKGNLNNHIGIPLTILSIQKDAEMAIIEMGANHQKEIESYCKYAEPSHGYITNIGKAHLDGFGGIEGVKKGKGELFEYLLQTKGKAFINSANPTLMEMQKFADPILFPGEDDFYNCQLLETNPFVKIKAENGEEVQTHLIGSYNFDNIAAALCIAKFFGVPEKDANAAVAEYIPENNRSQIIKKNSNTIILDAYNANPSSMKAAIENLKILQSPKKVAILGDMFELGEESEKEHKDLGKLLETAGFTKAIVCGKHMAKAKEANKNLIHFTEREALIEFLRNNAPENSTILIKGSRGMGLEKLLEVF